MLVILAAFTRLKQENCKIRSNPCYVARLYLKNKVSMNNLMTITK